MSVLYVTRGDLGLNKKKIFKKKIGYHCDSVGLLLLGLITASLGCNLLFLPSSPPSSLSSPSPPVHLRFLAGFSSSSVGTVTSMTPLWVTPVAKPAKHYTLWIRTFLLDLQLAAYRHTAARKSWKKRGPPDKEASLLHQGLPWHFCVLMLSCARGMPSFIPPRPNSPSTLHILV